MHINLSINVQLVHIISRNGMQILHIILDKLMHILHTVIEGGCKAVTELKKCRMEKNLTQQETANRLGVSLRSYITYENDLTKTNTVKYRFLLQEIKNINRLDEEHGIQPLDQIRRICAEVFAEYQVDFCYLFGSYAKGTAGEKSDIDLLISAPLRGLAFFGLAETLREKLHKRIDLLDLSQLLNNVVLLKEVLKDGIKIYG